MLLIRFAEDANVFVCMACDEKGGVDAGDHRGAHTLVRCMDKVSEGDENEGANSKTEERLTALETQIAALTGQMNRIEGLLQALLGGQGSRTP